MLSAQIIKARTEADGANCTGTRSTSSDGLRVCLGSHIQLTTEVSVTSSAGASTSNPGYVKVGQDGSVSVTVTVKLASPPDLRVSTGQGDWLYFPGWNDRNKTISGFGVTLTPQDTSGGFCGTVNGYAKCQSDHNISQGTTLASSPGKYDAYFETSDLKTFSAGDIVYTKTFTIPASDFARLKITNLKTDTNPGLNTITAYPNLIMNFSWSADDWTTFVNAGKSVYIQLYKTDAEAKADTSVPSCGANDSTTLNGSTAPSCVPAYGANTGAGNNVGGNGGLGSGIFALIGKVIGGIAFILQELIYGIHTFLLVPLLSALLSIRTYTDTFASVIYPGWVVVRNASNILFVISIIAIAMGTLFRVDAYQYKHLLVQLIIAALLVNFSLVIGQSVLGLADTIQNQFLPNSGEIARTLGKILILNRTNVENWSNMMQNNGASFAGVVAPLFDLSLSLGSFAVFAALVAFLAIRVVALWIYLMVSPIAYVAGVLPQTANLRDQWWSGFIKYAFFTPIIAFFLNIGATLVVAQSQNPVLQNISDVVTKDPTMAQAPSIATFMFSVGSNIILLIFIFVGLQVADKLGIIGGSAVADLGKKGFLAPFAAAGSGLQLAGTYAGRKWNEFTANKIRGHSREVPLWRAAAYAATNPKAVLKGMKERQEELSHAAQAKAEAAGLEVAEQRFSSPKAFLFGRKKVIPRVLAHEKHEEDEFAKQYSNMSRENVARTAAELSTLGFSDEDLATKRGVIKVALSKGYIDDIVMEASETEAGRAMLQKMKDEGLIDDADFKNGVMFDPTTGKMNTLQYNNKTRRALYFKLFGKVKDSHGNDALKDHAAARLITEEGEIEGMNTGHLEYMTDMYFNHTSGHYEFYKMNSEGRSEGEERMAAAEIAKRNSRTQAGIAWHSLMSSDGKYFSKDVFAKISKAISENPPFMQERTANMLVAGTVKQEDVDQILAEYRKTGELKLDQRAYDRLKEMMSVDERATVAAISRFLNDASQPAIDKRMKEGAIKVTGHDPIKISTKSIPTIPSESTVRSLTKDDSDIKISADTAGKAQGPLKNYDSSTTMPDYNAVLNDVIAAGITKRTEAEKVVTEYNQQLAKQILNVRNVDVMDVASRAPSVNFDVVVNNLSSRAVARFGDVVYQATIEGMSKGTRYATDAEKIDSIKGAVESALKSSDIKKKLDNEDVVAKGFNVSAFANEIYNKLR